MCADGPHHAQPSAFTVLRAPAGTRFGPIRRFSQIDSTNRYLLDEARAGAAEGAVAVADYQSAGRGRLGRRWEAPPGSNLLASVLVRPTLAIDELHLCTVALSLAAAAACERAAGLVPGLKWPNDLVVGEHKLGGILAEAIPSGPDGGGPAVVVGLGLNVQWPPPDSEQPSFPATSIWRETTTRVDPLELLDLVLTELETRLGDLAHGAGRARLAGEFRRRCDTLGTSVLVTLAGGRFTGTAVDITVEGHLVVDTGVGRKTVAAGDVVHLRDPG